MRGSNKRSPLETITDPALYQDLVDIFSRVLEVESDKRALFLEERCRGRPDLLRLAQALLQADQEGGVNIRQDPADAAGDSSSGESLIGRSLAHYQIREQIGQGGMGVIYRATDTRLERTVVLKVMHPALLKDRMSRERLVREAQALASIDHPNVCTVYGIEEADGLIFISMAYLTGATLDQKLENGPLPVKEAVDIAIQTARALAAAHAKGITHRDIKPSNVMLTDGGPLGTQVRVLDFGIARLNGGTALTEKGLAIGTVCYMAPEQVGGSQVDARADVWSLGIVLYEMLAGHVPFAGQSLSETLAAIAGPTPVPIHDLGRSVSSELVSILAKATDKSPAKRYQSAYQFASELEAFRSEITSSVAISSRKHRRGLMLALLAVLLCLGAGVAVLIKMNGTSTETLKIVPFTFDPGYQQYPAISPDGETIAFAGNGKEGNRPLEIYVQLIDSTEALRVTSAPLGFEDRFPVWNESGSKIAYLRGNTGARFGRILTSSSLGGAPIDLGVDGALRLGKLSWSANGDSLAFAGVDHSGNEAIFELSLQDRAVHQRSFPAHGESDCCPQYDPAGERLAFVRNGGYIVIARSNKQPERRVPAEISYPALTWTPDGDSIVYSWFGELAKVDVGSGVVSHSGEALFGSHIRDIVIRGKRMVFVRADVRHSIWKLNLESLRGKPGENARGIELTASTRNEDSPDFSPDGGWIAFASDRLGLNDIWIGAADGTKLRRLTSFEGQSAGTPRWSPDGKWIAFDLREHSRKPEVWVIPALGGAARPRPAVPGGGDVPSWSRDGRWIYYHSPADDEIWKQPSEGGPSIQVTQHGGFEGFESADGKYLYYSKNPPDSGIWRLDFKNKSEASVASLGRAAAYRHWALAPDGIYFVPNAEALSPSAAVRFLDFATAKTSRVAVVGRLDNSGPGALSVSRDEKSLLYVHVDRDNRNIMLAENYKP